MNDLFNQFASAFGKKEELSPADEFLAKKNKELEEKQQAELDALESPEETVSAMQPSKSFDEENNNFEPENLGWFKGGLAIPLVNLNAETPAPPFMGLEYNNPSYDSMPQGQKEAQQRNGVRDHGLTGSFEWTDKSKTKVAFVQKPNGTFYVNNPDELTPQIKSIIDRKFPDADYVGTGDKVLYTGGIDPVSTDEQADLFEKEPLIVDHLNLIEKNETPEIILDRLIETGTMYQNQKTDKIYIAIDPGKSGGISAVDTNGNVVFKKEMPLLNDELDAVELSAILSDAMSNYNCMLVVEDVHSIFGVSASNNFVFGWVCGQIDAVVKLSKIKHEYIQPKFWQKNCWTNSDMIYKPLKEGQKRASVDTKATSLITAMRLFPREDLRGHVEIKYYGDTKENRKLNRAGEPIHTKKNKPHDGIVDSLLMAEVARRLNL